jgi:ATP-dependent Clp protease adapter protein ClpS
MAENLVRSDVKREQAVETIEDDVTILIHNDAITPRRYIILVLRTIFELSDELAEHIAWLAQTKDNAPVVTIPRSEAEGLVIEANIVARLDGFPLTFELETRLRESQKERHQSFQGFALFSMLLSILMLLAVGLSVADGGDGITLALLGG